MDNPGHDRAALLDIVTVPVPSGLVEPPLDDSHVIDLHLGGPVQVSCRMEGVKRQALQHQGQFCLVPAGMAHRWVFERPAHALLLRLNPALFRETADAMGLRANDADLAPAIHVRDPHIEAIGWMLQAEDHDAYPGGRIFRDSLASALAARLLGMQSRTTTPPPSSKRARALPARRLRQVLEYIDAHLDEDLSLGELATIAGYSLSHFKPLFKQAVGKPVHRFVLERRVERARTLLLGGRKSMLEIAMEAGFSHPSHMARCMRRVLGVSPSEVAASAQ